MSTEEQEEILDDDSSSNGSMDDESEVLFFTADFSHVKNRELCKYCGRSPCDGDLLVPYLISFWKLEKRAPDDLVRDLVLHSYITVRYGNMEGKVAVLIPRCMTMMLDFYLARSNDSE